MGTIQQYIFSQFEEFQRTNLWSVLFDPPFTSLNKVDYGSIVLRDIEIPGITVNTLDSIYNNRTNFFASNLDLDPITMSFYVDSNNKSYAFFVEWVRRVISPNRILNYKSEYAGTVEIGLHGRFTLLTDLEVVNIKLKSCFPVNVSPVQLSQDSQDSIMRFDVSFRFDDIEFTFGNGYSDALLSSGITAESSISGLIGLI